MSHGDIIARHYLTRKTVRIGWQSGRITLLAETDSPAHPIPWVAPPLFDLQINGYAGVDFQSDFQTTETLTLATQHLWHSGCAKFLLTLITDDWPKMLARLQGWKQVRDASPALKTSLVGWHLEGPFLSPVPGYHGTHDPACMIHPTPQHIRELGRITAGDPVLLTMDPDCPGALDAIQQAVSLGMKISLGHTNASAEVLQHAIRAGASGFTHFGNGCPGTMDRKDNILWRVLDTPGLTISLIPDAIHVSPALFRLCHRLLPPDAIYYITDAMAAADAGPGRHRLGKLEVLAEADGSVWHPSKTHYAGSALKPWDGVLRAAHMLNCPWQEAWRRFSEVPAQWMGLPDSLKVGQSADFCVISQDDDGRLGLKELFLAGQPRLPGNV